MESFRAEFLRFSGATANSFPIAWPAVHLPLIQSIPEIILRSLLKLWDWLCLETCEGFDIDLVSSHLCLRELC